MILICKDITMSGILVLFQVTIHLEDYIHVYTVTGVSTITYVSTVTCISTAAGIWSHLCLQLCLLSLVSPVTACHWSLLLHWSLHYSLPTVTGISTLSSVTACHWSLPCVQWQRYQWQWWRYHWQLVETQVTVEIVLHGMDHIDGYSTHNNQLYVVT